MSLEKAHITGWRDRPFVEDWLGSVYWEKGETSESFLGEQEGRVRTNKWGMCASYKRRKSETGMWYHLGHLIYVWMRLPR